MTHLKALKKYYENIEYWEDTKLRGGDKWREGITTAIDNANVAILLVSEDSELGDFQAINSPDRTLADLGNDKAAIDRVYLDLNKKIKSLIG